MVGKPVDTIVDKFRPMLYLKMHFLQVQCPVKERPDIGPIL
jgi:hypothetical protein